jgi:hypothetical protein
MRLAKGGVEKEKAVDADERIMAHHGMPQRWGHSVSNKIKARLVVPVLAVPP